MTRFMAILLTLILAPSAWGQCYGGRCYMNPRPAMRAPAVQSHSEFPFIGKIVCPGVRSNDVGTGTIIDHDKTHSFILTAAHVIRGATRILFYLPSGRVAECTLVKADGDNDWAILRCPVLGIKPAKSALSETVEIQIGDEAGVYGYAGGSRFLRAVGRVKQYVSGDKGKTWNMIETTCGTISGMSGGPVVVRGRVVGVITGGDRGCCVGPCLPRLRAVIRAVLPPYRRPVVVPVVSTPPDSDAISMLAAELAALRAEIRDITLKPGPPGKDGKDGPPGNDGAIPLTTLKSLVASEVAARMAELPPIHVQVFKGDTLIDEEDVYLGGTLPLRLIPVTKD